MTEYAIEIENVTKKFGDVTAVNNVSLKIKKGEFFSILGPSGSGKTTLLRSIAGFEYPDTGDVILNNKKMGDLPAYKRREKVMVFQNLALFPHMNVFENIAYGLKVRGVKSDEITKRVNEQLAIVRLTGYGERRINQLSGGEQQRVAIARSLVNKPEVLLLDEPLSSLDRRLKEEMQIELKKLHERVGITFVYVTHDQELVLTVSEKIAVMNHGKIEQIGTPEEIYNSPASKFIASFIGDINLIEGKIEKITSKTCLITVNKMKNMKLEANIQNKKLKENDEVLLAIRPEYIDVESKSKKNNIKLKITEKYFQGPVTIIRGQIGDTELFIKTKGSNNLKKNDNTSISVNPENITVLQ